MSLLFIIVIILIALVFDFTNGMHDAANSISTIVSTRVLSPRQAVIWAAFFNFVAFLIFHTTVAETIGKGMVLEGHGVVEKLEGRVLNGIEQDMVAHFCSTDGDKPEAQAHPER